ncbi:MAG: 30S ribosomal protein S18 [Candidatus Woesebacteria bacterium GW2011_GWB1_39_12]|uniref:Small ribosomal subunit protein bS18 n=2 Tax=Candidatus Woeseibacteriota TaxID=1752722 RepID=A0A0G0MDX4_9BACT|nr:MAG: 30S ribosomal protein S18 [Candidatus Woesebacteria bacterium GW2011_GWA1_39_12]KKR00713.1 MAG: 30S ribosomal protein S18 [Candidatus Woesebacteria bacterium GW2011_GWB1_39_12]
MLKKNKQKRQTREIKRDLKCPFCEEHLVPDYKDYKRLERFLSDRGKILGRDRSGVCARHQRILSLSIKRARYLGLLPFTPSA